MTPEEAKRHLMDSLQGNDLVIFENIVNDLAYTTREEFNDVQGQVFTLECTAEQIRKEHQEMRKDFEKALILLDNEDISHPFDIDCYCNY